MTRARRHARHGEGKSRLTIKEVLVVLVVIQIATILFDTRIDSKSTWVDLLDPQIICTDVAIHLALLVSVLVADPDALDFFTSDVVVPFMVWSSCVFLWCRKEAGGRHIFRVHQRDFIPHCSCLICES